MKRKLIALCVSSVLVGSGIIFNMNQDVSVPTVEKLRKILQQMLVNIRMLARTKNPVK